MQIVYCSNVMIPDGHKLLDQLCIEEKKVHKLTYKSVIQNSNSKETI